MALHYATSPLTVTAILWPDWRCWQLDIDSAISDARLAVLHSKTGVRVDVIRHSTLRQINTHTPWVNTLATRGIRRYTGLSYCAHCLLEDHQPYYRRHWRFAWVCICPKHKIILSHRCTHCSSALQPHRHKPEAGSLANCAVCGHTLISTNETLVSEDEIQCHAQLANLFSSGTGEIFGVSHTAQSWLDHARYLLLFIRRSMRQ